MFTFTNLMFYTAGVASGIGLSVGVWKLIDSILNNWQGPGS